LDVLTAENLRRDLLELWLDKKIPTKSIILVTHGIEEAVYMADRAVILSSGPARVIEDIAIDIPRWRDKKAADFIAMVDRIYSLMTKKELRRSEPAIYQPGKITVLPYVSAGALTGFLELLEDLNERTDLYKLADRLVMDIEDFFPIIELASLLGLAKVVEGDIELTPEGIEFARATVLKRKELFKDQLLKNIPFITQMINVMQAKANKNMSVEFFEDLIAHNFGDEVAKTQMQLIINWGRYAELFGYDKVTELVYLETLQN
jgi:NitT/TauT family transport system ATP-binding protein